MPEIPATRASLLLRLRDPRDVAAWTEFVELYAPLVYWYVRKQGIQDADAADLSQDVLVSVAGAVGRLEYDAQRGAFRNWLFTIVRRKLSDWWSAARPRGSGDSDMQRQLEQLPAPEDAEAAWDVEWEQRTFAWACEHVKRDVTDTTWQAFWLTAVDGQSGRQVADLLGMSLTAVYVARSRVLARLKDLVRSVNEP